MKTKIKTLTLFPHEVFEKIQSVRAASDRIQILKENSSFAIRSILQINFNDWIKLDLPEGTPPYTKDTNPPEFSSARIDNAIKIFKYLVVGDKKLTKVRKEVKFIQLLEALNEKDAAIMVAIKDKNLEKLYPAVTPTLVRKAFPNLIKEKQTDK